MRAARRVRRAACGNRTRSNTGTAPQADPTRCTSRPTPVTGSASPGSPRNAGWSRRSPSGLLTDAAGFPLMVEAFEGNKAETTTMLPDHHRVHGRPPARRRHRRRRRGHDLRGQPGARSRPPGCRSSSAPASPTSPTWSTEWRRQHPDEQLPDGQVLTQPWPAGPSATRRRDRGHLLPVPARPGPAHAARDRRAGRQGRDAPSRGRCRSSATGSSA